MVTHNPLHLTARVLLDTGGWGGRIIVKEAF